MPSSDVHTVTLREVNGENAILCSANSDDAISRSVNGEIVITRRTTCANATLRCIQLRQCNATLHYLRQCNITWHKQTNRSQHHLPPGITLQQGVRMKSLSFTIPSARLPYQLHCLLWVPDDQDIPLTLARVPQSYDEEHEDATSVNTSAPASANYVPASKSTTPAQSAAPAQSAVPVPPALPRVRGTIQLMHGMCEHLGRYSHVARQLTARGYVVFGMDMPGHGKSVPDNTELGHIPLKEDVDGLLADEHALFTLVNSCYASSTPHFLLGHSLGSFLARAFLARFKPDVSAVALTGAGQVSPVLRIVGSTLTRLLIALHNEHYCSRFIDALGAGAYAKAFQPARTPFDWLSRNPQVVDAYLHDPLCGAPFSVSSYLVTSHVLRAIATETPRIFSKQHDCQALQTSQVVGSSQAAESPQTAEPPQAAESPQTAGLTQAFSTSQTLRPHVQHEETCTITSFTCASAPSSDTFAHVAILFCSGIDDVVGNRGKGVMQAAKSLVKAGFSRVTVRLYDNARHEVLNEDCAPDVVSAIVAWFDDAALHVPAVQPPAQPSAAQQPSAALHVPAVQPPAQPSSTHEPIAAPPSVPPRQKA